jgi:hypothetical protein
MATLAFSVYHDAAGQLRDCKMAVIWICLGVGLLYIWLSGYWLGWFVAFFGCALAVQAAVEDPDDTLCHTLFRLCVLLIASGIPFITWRWLGPREDRSPYGRATVRLCL